MSTNGIVSFGKPFYAWRSELFPGTHHTTLVAPFWSDIDIRGPDGNVYYHVYDDPHSPLVVRASREVNESVAAFDAHWVLVVTWDNVPAFPYTASVFRSSQVCHVSESPPLHSHFFVFRETHFRLCWLLMVLIHTLFSTTDGMVLDGVDSVLQPLDTQQLMEVLFSITLSRALMQ